MSYLHPLLTAVNATWQGAPEHTRPAYNQADATWQAAAGAPEDTIGALYAELPPPPITITLAATAATITPATLAAALPTPSLPLTLQATGESITYTSVPPHIYPPLLAVNASWEGRPFYTRPPWDQADAGWTLSAEPPAPDVHVGTLLAELPLPPLTALTLQATERPTTPAPLLWARLPLVRPAPPTLIATGEIIATANALISLPAPSLPIGIQANAELVQSASAAIQLPPPELPLLARIRERHHHATMAAALPPPQIAITIAATGDMVQNAAMAVSLPVHAYMTPLTVQAIAGHQDIDLTGHEHTQGITTRDPLPVGAATRSQTAAPLRVGISAQQQQAKILKGTMREIIEQGQIRVSGARAAQQQMIRLNNRMTEVLDPAIPISSGLGARQKEAIRTRHRHSNRQKQAVPIQLAQASPHAEAIRRRNRRSARHQHGLPQVKGQSLANQEAIRTQTRQTADHQHGMHPLPGYWWPYRLDRCRPTAHSWHDAPVYTRPTGTANASWQGANEYEYPITFCRHQELTWWPDYSTPAPEPEPPPGQIIIPIREVYIVINQFSLTRVSDGEPIPATDCRASIDADSWTWSWSASMPANALELVRQANGDPVELLATFNGESIRVIVEGIRRDRRFGDARLRISGRGRAAWLADPYAPIGTRSNAEQRTAQQLLQDALTINGVPIGWALDWQIDDWQVPAGVWSHTGSYIDAALRIAEAGGAYIQAHDTLQTLRILPRYPLAPWHWGSATPHIIIPEDVCEVEGIDWQDRPNYNAVWVHGGDQGRADRIRRTGLAADIQAPTIVDALATDALMTRQRGLAVLADTGKQAHISLRLPVLPETGIIHPGHLVEYTEQGNTHRGITRSLKIDQTYPDLWQTITLETHQETAA
ncbi:MAG: hypothetical protein ACNA7T_05140 [Haliea sp.]